jgi:hypothetical protein
MCRRDNNWIVILTTILLCVASSGVRAAMLETVFTEDWESGQEDWDVRNGVWEIGTPTAGPSECYMGNQCAGTVLSGNYPRGTDSRLGLPTFAPIQLPTVAGMEFCSCSP